MEQAVDEVELGGGRWTRITVVADQLPDNAPVFLLDRGLVVLVVGPTPGEGELFVPTVPQETGVEERAPVIRIDVEEREREAFAEGLEGGQDGKLALVRDGCALRPPLAMSVASSVWTNSPATVRHQIDLQKARNLLIPGRVGADRDLAFEEQSRLGRRPAPRAVLPALCRETSINGRRTQAADDLPE